MKLYAKVKSERASKGQGGNSFIEVELKDEDQEINYTVMYTPFSIQVYDINGKMILDREHKTKGKKQKTERRMSIGMGRTIPHPDDL